MPPKALREPRPRVLVAGGGVGALEAVLALRSLAGDLIELDLVAPGRNFVYRAMTVAEPFGYARALRVPYSRLAHTHRVLHVEGTVAKVFPGANRVSLADGTTLGYQALIVAVGARPEPWLDGAISFTGPDSVGAVAEVLRELRTGVTSRVCFAVPPDSGWALPAYELALLTATFCAEHGVTGTELSVATPEEAPLAAFGPAASRVVRDLLSDRGIALRSDPGDAEVTVALPRLFGQPIPGLPDENGFITVDEFCAVPGLTGVHAVGDATNHFVKQGGLAAQQADVAAAAVAQWLDLPVTPEPYEPVLRGLLLTGVASAYLRSGPDGGAAAFDALWWPPTKVAGRHLGPYLADAQSVGEAEPLADRPVPEDIERAAHDRAELRRLAVDMAESDAKWGDHRSALRWLQTVEWLDGTLNAELAARRQQWRAAVRQEA